MSRSILLLWEQRYFIVRFTTVGVLLAVITAFILPSRYESTTQLIASDQDPTNSLALLASIAGPGNAGIASQVLGVKSSGAIVIAAARSRTVQHRLIDRFDLRSRFGVRNYEQAREALNGNTSLFEDRKSGVIALTYVSNTPESAAAIAKGYVEEINRLLAEVNTSSAHRERVFLEERLKVVKHDLDKAAKDFSQFATKNSAIDIPAQGKAMVEGAARLHGEMVAAQAELRGLEQIYSDNNVRVRALRARIAELQKQLGKLGGDDESNAFPSLQKLPVLGLTYADLYRQTKIQEAVYEVLVKQYELAKVQEAKEVPTVRVLDEANVPETRSRPERRRLVMIGFGIALVGAIVVTFSRAKWRSLPGEHPMRSLTRELWRGAKADLRNAGGWLRRRNGQPSKDQDVQPPTP